MSEKPPVQPPPGVALVWSDSRSLQFGAIGTLTFMGSEGLAVLQRLHAQGTVREPAARAYLDTLANHGFGASRRH